MGDIFVTGRILMKYILYTLMMFYVTPVLFGQETTDNIYFLNTVQLAKKENKILIIEFWGPTCGPCIKLKRDIFDNDKNKDFLDKYFLIIKLSPADAAYESLFKYFKLTYESSVLYFDKDGNEIERTIGYDGDKESYLNFLKDVACGRNLYKNVLNKYQQNSSDAMSNYLLAKKLSFRYQFEKANKYFSNVLINDPEDTNGLHAECRFKIAENELITKGKIDKLQEYIKIDVKNDFIPKAYIYLINDLHNKKDAINCLKTCDEAYAKYPENQEILNKYAWMICSFKINKDYTKALDLVQKAIDMNPESANYYATQAWLFYESGDKEKAIKSMEKAIALNPHPTFKDDLKKFAVPQ
jgi:tetratricopeptide (TPR) repeat protein